MSELTHRIKTQNFKVIDLDGSFGDFKENTTENMIIILNDKISFNESVIKQLKSKNKDFSGVKKSLKDLIKTRDTLEIMFGCL